MSRAKIHAATRKRREGVTIERLPEPPFERLIRRPLVSDAWFPLTYTEKGRRKLKRGIAWLLAQPGLLGSTWRHRRVWRGVGGFGYAYWGLVPRRVMHQRQRNPTAQIDAIDTAKQRVRLRLSSGSTTWLALADLVHLWLLVSFKRLPSLPKGVRRKALPAAIADVRVR